MQPSLMVAEHFKNVCVYEQVVHGRTLSKYPLLVFCSGSQLITVQLLKDLIATVTHLGIKWQMGKEPREVNRGPAPILAVLAVSCIAQFLPFLLYCLVQNPVH